MKKLSLVFVLALFFSCKKKTEDNVPDTAAANTVSVLIDGKSYSAPVTFQGFANAGNSILELEASSQDIEINIHAKSTIDHYGAGNYFLYCCENTVLDKATGTLYKGIENGLVNSYPSQKGRLTVTNADLQGYSGTFSLEGRNALGQTKSIAGSFKVVY